MAEVTPQQSQNISQSRGTKDFRRAQRAYDKKVQKYALGKQSDAQVAELARHNQVIANLQKQVGAAQGDDEKLAALKQAFADEDSKHKETMQNTADLSQYKKDFDEEAYDKEQAEKQTADENSNKGKKSFGQTLKDIFNPHVTAEDMKDDKGSEQAKDDKGSEQAKDSNDERSGEVSTALTDSLSAYFQKQALGDSPRAPNSEHLRNQAEMHDKQAGDEQKNAQQNAQVANRDYRVEAEKNAASQAAAENSQKVKARGNISAGASALERDVKAADYSPHMNRQDQQRAESVKNQREMWGARQTAEDAEGLLSGAAAGHGLLHFVLGSRFCDSGCVHAKGACRCGDLHADRRLGSCKAGDYPQGHGADRTVCAFSFFDDALSAAHCDHDARLPQQNAPDDVLRHAESPGAVL